MSTADSADSPSVPRAEPGEPGRTAWQALAGYAVASWIVLQVGETVSSLIGLPLWFGRALVVALLAGIVVLLATALAQTARIATWAGLPRVLTYKRFVVAVSVIALLLVSATGASVALRAWGVGPFATLQGRGVLEVQDRLILTDFNGEDEPSDLSRAVGALLRIDLGQSPAFSLLDPIQLAPVLARMRRDPTEPLTLQVALEAARREGVKAVVTGELLQVGDALVVSARIVETSSTEVLTAVRETTRDPSDLPRLVDQLAARLRERIGDSLRRIQREPALAEVTTSSMRALQLYVRALRADDLGDGMRAVDLLESAIDVDPSFTMAYRKLGILLNNQDVDERRAREAFARAYDLRAQLTERERGLTEAAYHTYVVLNEQAAMNRYVSLLELYPSDRIALNNLAMLHWAQNRLPEAVPLLLRSIRQGGAPAVTFSSAATILQELADTANFREVVELFVATHPGNPSAVRLKEQLPEG